MKTFIIGRTRQNRQQAVQHERDSVLARANALLNVPPPPIQDDVDHFCKYVAQVMKPMEPRKKGLLMMKFMQNLYQAQFGNNENPAEFANDEDPNMNFG